MKKLFLLFVALVAVAATAYAQNEQQCATLQHGDEVSVFIGTGGFTNAYNAAEDGDVITLTAGTFSFNNGYIQKSISVYGAGFENDEETGTAVTTLDGKVSIFVNEGGTKAGIHLEGLYFNNDFTLRSGSLAETLKDCTFKKCYFQNTVYNGMDTLDNVVFNQCVLMGGMNAGSTWGDAVNVIKNGYFTHCFLNGPIFGYNPDLSFILLDHCISNTVEYIVYGRGKKLVWTNSVFTVRNGGNTRGLTGDMSVIKNCLARPSNYIDPTVTVENLYEDSDIFTDEVSGDYSSTRTFELLKPNTWVGTDGSEVGLHGGTGWNKIPGIPVVKNLKLKVNGTKLNVTYDAEAR